MINTISGCSFNLQIFENDFHCSFLAMTQMSPNDARMAFPCFDEPAMKATFNISIIRESHLNAVANTPLLSSDDL
jgi:aminopeptidase N